MMCELEIGIMSLFERDFWLIEKTNTIQAWEHSTVTDKWSSRQKNIIIEIDIG